MSEYRCTKCGKNFSDKTKFVLGTRLYCPHCNAYLCTSKERDQLSTSDYKRGQWKGRRYPHLLP